MKKVIAALLLTSVLCSCGKPIEKVRIPPTAETSDGERIPVPMGGFEVGEGVVPKKYAGMLCDIFGRENTLENLNSLCFGENIVGVGLASVVYFGKYAENLTEDEWKLFCDIAGGKAKAPNMRYEFVSGIPDSAYFDAMVEEAVNELCDKKELSRDEAFDLLYSGGITIKTPFDSGTQSIVDEVYSAPENFTDDTGTGCPQSACVVMGYDGGVKALSGGNNGGSAYNRGYRIPHKPGSAVKPLSIYAPAIDKRKLNFSSLIPDEPLIFRDESGSYEWPKNHDGVYDGRITLTMALRKSKNAAAAQTAEVLTPAYCTMFMKECFGITTLTSNDMTDAAMALGALEKGVYLHELAAAYAVFGSGGVYSEPHFFTEITDKEGNTILKNDIETRNALDSGDAWIMNRLLYYNVCAKGGIASEAAIDGVEVIGKTGTSANDRNFDSGRLFVGCVPDCVTAVWLGYDDESSIEESGCISPTVLWRNIVSRFDMKEDKFAPDKEVIECEFCTVSGDIATDRCPEKETGFYTPDNIPNKCVKHGSS